MPITIANEGGAVAHLLGQLATKSEVRGSNSTLGQVNFSLLLCVYPALNGQQGRLRPGESKGSEESNGTLPHNNYRVCHEQSGPYSWFPDALTKCGTHFTFYLQISRSKVYHCVTFHARV
ncbi:hypothetical protein PoB_001386200 [Plakobranchus ocellatus]|uniref:Uncharacterized protein n=1 Tax=Plakobranchus ocellatus TaxID=259542 RepID=A0AAV3YYF7_9GAST|nr:hypothetical protein PoB_001386200 [Plakobranchus ocellatus]